jgi:hypothetical protein
VVVVVVVVVVGFLCFADAASDPLAQDAPVATSAADVISQTEKDRTRMHRGYMTPGACRTAGDRGRAMAPAGAGAIVALVLVFGWIS